MKQKKCVRISQCMIVKNEEKNIERALSWGREIMWEQIVVDTGSTDRTIEIAKDLGAKVYSFPWTDDFSAAKNHAIEIAKGDWICFLDADEYMMSEDARKLKELLDGLEKDAFDGISTGWQQLNGEGKIFASGTQIRFFRNQSDIRYRRRIHEQLESLSGRDLKVGDAVAAFSIFHTGYQGEGETKNTKSSRNRRLILEELKEHPEDSEMMGYMGDECLDDGERDEAEQWYRHGVEHMPIEIGEGDQRSAVTYTRLLTILTEKEGCVWEDAEEIYQKAVKHLPKEADFDYIAGRYFAASGQASRAVDHLEAALEKLNTYGCSNRALILAGNLLDAYELLVRCSYEAGEGQKCVTYAVAHLQYDKYAMSVLSRLLMVLLPEDNDGLVSNEKTKERIGSNFALKEENQRILEFFAGLYDLTSLKDRLFLVKTAQMARRCSFAEYVIRHVFTPEEQKALL